MRARGTFLGARHLRLCSVSGSTSASTSISSGSLSRPVDVPQAGQGPVYDAVDGDDGDQDAEEAAAGPSRPRDLVQQ